MVYLISAKRLKKELIYKWDKMGYVPYFDKTLRFSPGVVPVKVSINVNTGVRFSTSENAEGQVYSVRALLKTKGLELDRLLTETKKIEYPLYHRLVPVLSLKLKNHGDKM